MATESTKQIILDTLAQLGKEEADAQSLQKDDAIPTKDQSSSTCQATLEHLRTNDAEVRESEETSVESGWPIRRLRKYDSCFRSPVCTVGTLRKKGRLR